MRRVLGAGPGTCSTLFHIVGKLRPRDMKPPPSLTQREAVGRLTRPEGPLAPTPTGGQRSERERLTPSRPSAYLPAPPARGPCSGRGGAEGVAGIGDQLGMLGGRADGVSDDNVLFLFPGNPATKSKTWIQLTSPTLRPLTSE